MDLPGRGNRGLEWKERGLLQKQEAERTRKKAVLMPVRLHDKDHQETDPGHQEC